MLQASERALVVMREKAANEAKSEFMSLMCHEVRTPLNGCLASAGAPPPPLLPPACVLAELGLKKFNALYDRMNRWGGKPLKSQSIKPVMQ